MDSEAKTDAQNKSNLVTVKLSGKRKLDIGENDAHSGKRRRTKTDVKGNEPKLPRTKCPECNVELVKKQLKRHMNEIHSPDTPQFGCNMCEFVTKREFQLQKHKKSKHFEPMPLGRPTKRAKNERRSRSPFRVDEFKRRHTKSMKILDKVDDLMQWKEVFKSEVEEKFKVEMDSKNKHIENLTKANAAKDVEMEKLKIRLAILEQKLKCDALPSLEKIDELLVFLNLEKESTVKQIREAVKIRLLEVDPESPIDSSVTRNMSIDEREKMTIFLNQVQCALVEWKTNQ